MSSKWGSCLYHFSSRIQTRYRIFSIKRLERLFKTRSCRPGVYSGSGVYLLNAFFSYPFFYHRYWRLIELRTQFQLKTLKKCETISPTLSNLGESGKSFIKKHH